MRAKQCAIVLLGMVYGGCGGAGNNPLAPAGVNRPPEIVRVELVGYNVAGYGETLPLRVEVRDPDGDRVDCRYAVQAGRVVIDGSSPSTCVATYAAPNEGVSDRIDVTASDGRASTGSSATVALGPRSVPVAGGPTPSPGPQPTPGPNPTPTPSPSTDPGPQPTPTPTPQPNRNPTVTITGPAECQAPCQIVLTANASDPDGDPLTYAWSGCTSGSANTASCSIPIPGNYTASVTVSDGRGGSASTSKVLTGTTAPPVNAPPTVTATASAPNCHPRPSTPCSVAVQAQASDPNGDPLTYAWQGCASGTSPTSTCIVDALVTRTATVTVTDTHGASASASVNVAGVNAAPSVSASGGGSCHPVCSTSVSASGSDPDGDPLSYSWSGCASGSSANATCTVDQQGTETATVTASDGWASANAAVNSTGTNSTPNIGVWSWDKVPSICDEDTGIAWQVQDDDSQGSGTCSATVQGTFGASCTLLSYSCWNGSVGRIELRVGTSSGWCRATVTFTDRWGATTTRTEEMRACP